MRGSGLPSRWSTPDGQHGGGLSALSPLQEEQSCPAEARCAVPLTTGHGEYLRRAHQPDLARGAPEAAVPVPALPAQEPRARGDGWPHLPACERGDRGQGALLLAARGALRRRARHRPVGAGCSGRAPRRLIRRDGQVVTWGEARVLCRARSPRIHNPSTRGRARRVFTSTDVPAASAHGFCSEAEAGAAHAAGRACSAARRDARTSRSSCPHLSCVCAERAWRDRIPGDEREPLARGRGR